ncbi:xylulokinase [Kineococcus sp. SYSU DK018]|uniref:xylulokinase n=1 Tax=Kineococcus sp. SYSU DK018 TaxID=3383139 RepID=UPI003D7C3AD3
MDEQDLVLAFDLGTGSCKAALWAADGTCTDHAVAAYETTHPAPGRDEQRPADWWRAVVSTSRTLLGADPSRARRVRSVSLSGQSLGVVQLDHRLQLLSTSTPVWSDARGEAFARQVFTDLPEQDWYLRTGNGFPAGLYPSFKAGCLRREDPERWSRTRHLLGAKDYVNLLLTGEVATDHSHASGSGAYDLVGGRYDDELLAAAGLDRALLPEPREAFEPVGTLTREAASALGLPAGTPVATGAVDNACMALGSLGTTAGRTYASLGSSSWITTTSPRPVLDVAARPYVFRHAVPGLFISALSTFSSGTALAWLRETVAPDLDVEQFLDLGAGAPAGASGTLFLPMLAGGTPLEGGSSARGALVGLTLATGRADVARAAMEGIAFALRRSLDLVRSLSGTGGDLLLAGGGARHRGWNRVYADVLGVPLLRTSVDQQAATLGAATIAFAGLGAWSFRDAERPHTVVERIEPDPAAVATYEEAEARFARAVAALAPAGAEVAGRAGAGEAHLARRV